MENTDMKPSFGRIWFIAARPWSWPASIIPVLFGTALAVFIGGAEFKPWIFLAALAGMVILHSGANMLSDAHDLRNGLDKLGEISPVSGAVARGWLSPDQAERGSYLFFACGSALGLLVAAKAGLPVLWLGLAGVVVGLIYSFMKYRAFGDLAVLLEFGFLGTAGAWAAQAGSLSATPFIWSIPPGLIVVAILHANNWRDMASDRAGGIKTVAGLLGDSGSMVYYSCLLCVPFVFVLAGVLLSWSTVAGPKMPWSLLLVWLAFPMALDRIKKGARRRAPVQPLDFITLDGGTAQLNLVFGLLASAGLVLHRFGIG